MNKLKNELANMTALFTALQVEELDNGVQFKTTDEVVEGIMEMVYKYEIQGDELYLFMYGDGEFLSSTCCDLDDGTLLECMISLWNDNLDYSDIDD